MQKLKFKIFISFTKLKIYRLWVRWPNQQCHSTEGQWLVNQVIRIHAHQYLPDPKCLFCPSQEHKNLCDYKGCRAILRKDWARHLQFWNLTASPQLTDLTECYVTLWFIHSQLVLTRLISKQESQWVNAFSDVSGVTRWLFNPAANSRRLMDCEWRWKAIRSTIHLKIKETEAHRRHRATPSKIKAWSSQVETQHYIIKT